MTDDFGSLFSLSAAVAVVVSLFVLSRKISEISNLRTTIDEHYKEKIALSKALQEQKTAAAQELHQATQRIKETAQAEEEIRRLLEEQSKHFPWLASAFTELQQLRFQRDEAELRHKKHPAIVAAAKVAELARNVRETERQFRLTKYRIQFYENLFPWLIDLSGEDIETLIKERDRVSNIEYLSEVDIDEPAKKFLSDQEWASLGRVQKYQIALDRWKVGRKSSWQIGREFERFIGYRLEASGYDVAYHGAIEGLEDLGRDLIAKKSGSTLIVQCKYWSRNKEIHEKHVFQTYATAVEYALDNNVVDPRQGELFGSMVQSSKVTPVLIVSCALSERAKKAAKILGVNTNEFVSLEDYPMIKCNVAPGTKERIYHLPFDQQYDKVKIFPTLGECYVATVAEAEERGFRRAWRWRGS